MSVHAQADLIAALNVFFFIISVQYTVSYFKKHIQMCGIKKTWAIYGSVRGI